MSWLTRAIWRRVVVLGVLVCVCALATAARGRQTAQGAQASTGDRPLLLLVSLEDEPITPVTARFIRRAVRQAESDRAECLLIVLDTPGGLVDSTRTMVKDILASQTPVVVYVSPSGARAASAGVFITLASHVAAMAPGTHIGAAHPVQLGGLPIGPPESPQPSPAGDEGEEQPSPATAPSAALETKIVNDTVAWARSLAELRDRNSEWATQAVTESISTVASDALAEGVIDLMADDLDDLLAQLDGREVPLTRGTVTLRTAGAMIRTLEMWWGERVLAAISNPNIAFLLLMLGFYGILFELYTPGWGVPGTLGVVCLVMAFFGLAVLPISYVGLLLIAVALALFVAEAFVTSYGALAVGGAVCLVLGGLMLVDSPVGFMRISLGLVVSIAGASGLITVFLLSGVVRAHRQRVSTGGEGLVGTLALAQEDFARVADQYAGAVLAHGELWKAVSPAPVSAGQTLEVRDREGLTLVVRIADRPPIQTSPEASA